MAAMAGSEDGGAATTPVSLGGKQRAPRGRRALRIQIRARWRPWPSLSRGAVAAMAELEPECEEDGADVEIAHIEPEILRLSSSFLHLRVFRGHDAQPTGTGPRARGEGLAPLDLDGAVACLHHRQPAAAARLAGRRLRCPAANTGADASLEQPLPPSNAAARSCADDPSRGR